MAGYTLFLVFASLLSGAVSQMYLPWRAALVPQPYPWYPRQAPLLASRANAAPRSPVSKPNVIQEAQRSIVVPPNRPPVRTPVRPPVQSPMRRPIRPPVLPTPSARPVAKPTGTPSAAGGMVPRGQRMFPVGIPSSVLTQLQAKRAAMMIARRRALASKLRQKKRKEAEAAAKKNANPLASFGDALLSFIKGSPPPGPMGNVMQSKNRMSTAVASGCLSAVDTAENPLMSIIMPGGCSTKNDICPFTHRGRKCVEVSKGFGMCCPKTMTSGIIDLRGSMQRMNMLMEMFGA